MSNTTILGKYKSIRKLGKGAFGQVLLVQDSMGMKYALKMISLKSLQRQPFMLEYLQSQIQCMMTMHSPYIMRLVQSQQDQKYKYMVCQYCDGGDLLSYQAKQPNQVFTLQRAVQILVQVINGLQELHRQEYLHRDIKSTNILIKNENGKQLFKLADFGFSKKSSDVGGTVLGTQHYMSPQIYLGENYGFQVDMWAFGVLFFFMLNKEFPFKTNSMFSPQRKHTQLVKAAKKYSYQKAVRNTRKKIKINCTPQVQDLFNKIFQVQVEKRISFFEIRKHPIFAHHFPLLDQSSKILYSKVFQYKAARQSKLLKRQSLLFETSIKSDGKKLSNSSGIQRTKNLFKQKLHDTKENIQGIFKRTSMIFSKPKAISSQLKVMKQKQEDQRTGQDQQSQFDNSQKQKQNINNNNLKVNTQKDNLLSDRKDNNLHDNNNNNNQKNEQIIVSNRVCRKPNTKFPQQSKILQKQCDKLQFLYELGIVFLNSTILKSSQRLSLGFNIIKFYIVQLKNFIEKSSQINLQKKQPKLKWKEYCLTQSYLELIKHSCQDLNQAQMKYQFIYEQCQQELPQITKINQYFTSSFDSQINQKIFDGTFKLSYKKSTHYIFSRLHTQLLQLTSKKENSDIKLHYTMALIVICHLFNHIFQDSQKLKIILGNYFNEKNKNINTIDFSELHEWMTKTSSKNLKKITTNVIQLYFNQKGSK